MMVIPIVVMLAVTMVVAGCLEEGEQEIEVDEDLGELTIEHADEEGPGYNFAKGVNVTALTTVDNKSELEFVVNPTALTVTSTYQRIHIELLAEGEFDEYLDIKSFKFSAAEKESNSSLYNYIDFSGGSSRIEGGNIWPGSQQRLGVKTLNSNDSAYIGYDLESDKFTAETEVSWTMPHDNIGEEFTLQLEAVVDGGMSEEISATVEIHIECGDE